MKKLETQSTYPKQPMHVHFLDHTLLQQKNNNQNLIYLFYMYQRSEILRLGNSLSVKTRMSDQVGTNTGWSSFEMVLRYAHLSSDHLRDAAHRINSMKLRVN